MFKLRFTFHFINNMITTKLKIEIQKRILYIYSTLYHITSILLMAKILLQNLTFNSRLTFLSTNNLIFTKKLNKRKSKN